MRWLWQSLDEAPPGSTRNQPRATGVRLFGQVLARCLWQFIQLNLLFVACLLPSATFLALSLLGVRGTVTFGLAVVTAFPAGGVVSATLFVMVNELRDDPGVMWDDFKRKFAETLVRSLVPTLISAAFLYAQVHLWSLVLFAGVAIGLVNLVLGVASLIVFGMLAPYVFLQIAFVDLPVLRIFQNSVLIAFGNTLRSLSGALAGGAIWVAFVACFPGSLAALPLIVLLGFSLSWLLHLMWAWPVMDKQFAIDQTLRGRRAEQSGPREFTADPSQP